MNSLVTALANTKAMPISNRPRKSVIYDEIVERVSGLLTRAQPAKAAAAPTSP
ncbi:hypothetical protein LNV09_11555 [Paucibacter sp. B2R-40]|uniref:hypothetical protein n=1 Tax=Paucibacter sp. B2R-40 TaxID=2893554 RepID=UPI0021E4D254|nr:hypothetical protein [Paucibacter sp. B2R-40]MCV2354793.1 hypothetical protein [Paucibacter sp. B2R-40]